MTPMSGTTKRAAAVALFAVLAGATAVVVRESTADADLVVRAFRTDTPRRVPIVEVTSRGAGAHSPVAFLVHGFQCNRSMMIPLAKHLAANGVDAYALDLPGHGASLEPFSEDGALAATREALEAVVVRRGVPREHVVLVGHSYGASILARVVGEDPRFRTAVMLGPSYDGGVSPGRPASLLVLTAGQDYPYILSFAREMLRDATGGGADAAGAIVGDDSRSGIRAWKVLQGTGHVSLLFSRDAWSAVVQWIQPSLGVREQSPQRRPRISVVLALIILSSGIVFARSVTRIYADVVVAETSAPFGAATRLLLACIGTFALSVLFVRYVTPLALLRLAEGERIASLFATAGVLMIFAILLTCRRTPLPTIRQIARGLPVAFGSFAIVYAAAVISADSELYRLSLANIAPERRAATAVLVAALFPFFAFTDGVVDEVRRALGGGLAGGAGTLAATAVISALIAAALPLLDVRLGRFTGAVLVVGVLCAATGGILTRASRNPAVGPMFSAATAAWIIAIGFVTY